MKLYLMISVFLVSMPLLAGKSHNVLGYPYSVSTGKNFISWKKNKKEIRRFDITGYKKAEYLTIGPCLIVADFMRNGETVALYKNLKFYSESNYVTSDRTLLLSLMNARGINPSSGSWGVSLAEGSGYVHHYYHVTKDCNISKNDFKYTPGFQWGKPFNVEVVSSGGDSIRIKGIQEIKNLKWLSGKPSVFKNGDLIFQKDGIHKFVETAP